MRLFLLLLLLCSVPVAQAATLHLTVTVDDAELAEALAYLEATEHIGTVAALQTQAQAIFLRQFQDVVTRARSHQDLQRLQRFRALASAEQERLLGLARQQGD